MSAISTPNARSQRLYDLDALRAVAMFLGVVLHGSIFVLPTPQYLWPIHDPAATGDPTYKVVIDFIHGFRMPVFFLLSGFFSALLWQRRGLRALAVQRLKRVGIPFIVSCLTILPLSVWLLQLIAGRVEPYDFPPWALPLIWLFGTLGHLWFLWYLLLLMGCFLAAARAGLQFLHPAWWLMIPLSLGISLLMVEPAYGPDTAVTIVPEPALFFHYACFFVLGAFFYQRGMTVRRRWAAALPPAALTFWAGYYLLEKYLAPFGGDSAEAGTAFLFRNNLTLFAALLEAAFAWLMCFGLMGLFRWAASRESFAVRYLSDASYWMYLIHLPLVVIAQQLVLDLPIHYHLKFLLVVAGVTVALLATYQLAVRYTIIGRTLNGPRTRRRPGSATRAVQPPPARGPRMRGTRADQVPATRRPS